MRATGTGTRGAAATVHYIDLCTTDVELSAAISASDVQGDLLNTSKVLSARQALREGEGE